MSQGKTEALAAEYVLGTLDPNARQSFGQALERDPDLQKLVGDWERRLASLDHGVEPVEPPAGLWDRIESVIDASKPEATGVTVRAAEGAWQAVADGVDKKILVADPHEGFETFLLRLAPGSHLPGHDHKMAEDCMVLEGELTIGELHLSAGDFHMAPAGMAHGEIVSAQGALLYVRGEMRAGLG